MDVIVTPHPLSGTIAAPSSKSMAQRLIILAALADAPTTIAVNGLSEDILACARCVTALGASVAYLAQGGGSPQRVGALRVTPLPRDPSDVPVALEERTLDCGESGATLRFLVPVVAALGARATLTGHGRLSERPLSPLTEELSAHGVRFARHSPSALPLAVAGSLIGGRFDLSGSVSSQFVSGILLASAAIGEPVSVHVHEPFESRPYVTLTCQALATFGVQVLTRAIDGIDGPETEYYVSANQRATSPGTLACEGDWSQAAFWLVAGATGGGVEVSGLNLRSAQGDRAVLAALALFGASVSRSAKSCVAGPASLHGASFDVSDTPDLVPPVAVAAALAEGTSRLSGAHRLRLKESDRLESVAAALAALGIQCAAGADELAIAGGAPSGGVVDAAGDHRIAMMASVLAARAEAPVRIVGAECVAKSYPDFFADFVSLGGIVEEVRP